MSALRVSAFGFVPPIWFYNAFLFYFLNFAYSTFFDNF